jgi:fatty-acyl-CoA synthase
VVEAKFAAWPFVVAAELGAFMQSTMMRCPLLVSNILERAGKLFGDSDIVSANADGSYLRSTMQDLHERSRRLSAALQRAGIKPGDRVATLMWNQPEHV